MKSVFVVFGALAATAVAQSGLLPNSPECADKCVTGVLTTGVDSCSMTDFKCICGNEQFIKDIGQCILHACDEAGVKQTIAAAYDLCKIAGVEIPTTVPTLDSTSAPTSSPTSTPTATGKSNSTQTTTTTPSETSPNAAAANFVASGLGVAGAAAALFLL